MSFKKYGNQPMNHSIGPKPRQNLKFIGNGFTLIEVMTAVMIFSMVIASIYMILKIGLDAFQKGSVHIEMTQSGRVALSGMAYDLQRSVSPANSWNEPTLDETLDQVLQEEKTLFEQRRVEEEPGPKSEPLPRTEEITFKGSEKEVTFVVPEYLYGRKIPYDLREVKYWVDSDKGFLMKQYVRSILEVRKEELRAERTENETQYWAIHSIDDVGQLGDKAKLAVGNYITDLNLRYFDGSEWVTDWDSQEIINQEEVLEEALYDEDWKGELFENGKGERKGLPRAVEIQITLQNKDIIRTVIEIPASSLNEFDVVSETAYRTT